MDFEKKEITLLFAEQFLQLCQLYERRGRRQTVFGWFLLIPLSHFLFILLNLNNMQIKEQKNKTKTQPPNLCSYFIISI